MNSPVTPRIAFVALVVSSVLLGCESDDVTDPVMDPPDEPDGQLLEGDPDDPGLDALTMLVSDSVDDADIDDGLLLTRLTGYLDPDATVGEVNDALTAVDGLIVSMWPDLPAVSLRIPRAVDESAAAAVARSLMDSGAFLLAAPAWEAEMRPDDSMEGRPGTVRGSTLPEHVRVGGFAASWHAAQAARDANQPVVAFVPDIYFDRTVHPMIQSQQYVGSSGGTRSTRGGLFNGNHGVHVAGTIGASRSGNVAGVHPVPELLPIWSLPLAGRSFTDLLYHMALHFPSGRFVLNTSLGYNDPDFRRASKTQRAIDAAIWRALTRDVSARFVHATAAGNDGQVEEEGGESRYASPYTVSGHYADLRTLAAEAPGDPVEQRQAFDRFMDLLEGVDLAPDNLIIVGNSEANGTRAATSSRGATVRANGQRVVAPCAAADATCDGSVGTLSGTSMSTPQIAGLAAYIMNLRPALSPAQVITHIRQGYDASAGLVDAYRAVLATDQGLSSAPVRMAVLDVTDATELPDSPDGRFDEHDVAHLLDAITTRDAAGTQDHSRYDLNGNGFTSFTGGTEFDLNVSGPGAWDLAEQTIDGEIYVYDELDVTDLDVLCYYAYSSLYEGDTGARDDAILELCVDGLPVGIEVTGRTTRSVATANVCDNPQLIEEAELFDPFSSTLNNQFDCEDGSAIGSLEYSESIAFTKGSLSGVSAQGESFATASHLDPDDRFIVTQGSGASTLNLVFEVVDRPAMFTFQGEGMASVTGPNSVAEVEVSIFGPGGSTELMSRIIVQDPGAPSGTVTWDESGSLSPGFYSLTIEVRASSVVDRDDIGVETSASARLASAELTFSQ